MRAMPLQLSHWDEEAVVCVPASVVADLKSYHLHGVRFLYDCHRKKFKGSILNHEPGMNFPQQVAAFFSALHEFVKSPVLVVCSGKTLRAWHYHFSEGGYNVTVLSLKSIGGFTPIEISSYILDCEEVEEKQVVLAAIDDPKPLQKVKGVYFFAVVVEGLDELVTKLIIRQLKGEFNVGLTTRNFMQNRDLKLLWNMMKWTKPDVKKFDEFSQEDADNLKTKKNPYPEWWQRLPWNFCKTFIEPTEEEQQDYEDRIVQWARQQGLSKKLPGPDPPQKRKATRTTRSKKLLKIEKECDDESTAKLHCGNETAQPSTSKTNQARNHRTTRTRSTRSKLLNMLSESSDEGNNVEENDSSEPESKGNNDANSENKVRKTSTASKAKQTQKRKTTRATRSRMLNMLSESSDEGNNVEQDVSEPDISTGNRDANCKSKLRKTFSNTKQTQKRKTKPKMLSILSESSDEENNSGKEDDGNTEIKGNNVAKTKPDGSPTLNNDSASSDDTIIYDLKTSPKSMPTEEINTNSDLDSIRRASMLLDLHTNPSPTFTGSPHEQTNSLNSQKSKRNEILSLLYGDE